jgi:hypothetical protein
VPVLLASGNGAGGGGVVVAVGLGDALVLAVGVGLGAGPENAAYEYVIAAPVSAEPLALNARTRNDVAVNESVSRVCTVVPVIGAFAVATTETGTVPSSCVWPAQNPDPSVVHECVPASIFSGVDADVADVNTATAMMTTAAEAPVPASVRARPLGI